MPDSKAVRATPLAEAPANGETALFIIDMISEWSAPGLGSLLEASHAIAPRLAAFKRRCRAAGVPIIYANDNLGRWRSDFKSLVKAARDKGGKAAEIADILAPEEEDYFVLKPKHSAFFGTPLNLLLEHLEVKRVLLAGVSADQCVQATAAHARMQDYDVEVIGDCIAAPSEERQAAALRHFEEAMQITVTQSTDIQLPSPPS
jgi:nicotinamidase-related amidase